MTIIDRGCWERGCACYDSRIADETVDVVEKREWVGLTDEEIEACHDEIRTKLMNTYNTKDIYQVLEAKLKEKNT